MKFYLNESVIVNNLSYGTIILQPYYNHIYDDYVCMIGIENDTNYIITPPKYIKKCILLCSIKL